MAFDTQILADAKKKGRLQEQHEELDYFRLKEDFHHILRGTVIINSRVIPGFPKIKRIFTLEKGLGKNMPANEIYIEEKIDGFNLRVLCVNGKLFAFSRGGFLDAFSTEKVRDMKLELFFRKYPNYILCGEMIGNTPYTFPAKGYDVKLLVFDILDEENKLIPVEEKYALLKKFDISSVPFMGKFKTSDAKKIKQIALSINKDKKEGIVMKSPDRAHVVKYVVPNSDIEDVAHASHALFDMPAGFFHQRVLRSAIFIRELGLDKKKYAEALGAAFYDKLISQLDGAEAGEGVFDEFEITIKDPSIWDKIMKHMGKEVKVDVIFRREENGSTRIRFRKKYKETSRRFHEILNGKAVED
jgi:putative ATP-dependent DNA ligase